jgi:hypothetical protein
MRGISPRGRGHEIAGWDVIGGRHVVLRVVRQPAAVLRITNQRLAGRSARRRMYHGNQCAP